MGGGCGAARAIPAKSNTAQQQRHRENEVNLAWDCESFIGNFILFAVCTELSTPLRSLENHLRTSWCHRLWSPTLNLFEVWIQNHHQ